MFLHFLSFHGWFPFTLTLEIYNFLIYKLHFINFINFYLTNGIFIVKSSDVDPYSFYTDFISLYYISLYIYFFIIYFIIK